MPGKSVYIAVLSVSDTTCAYSATRSRDVPSGSVMAHVNIDGRDSQNNVPVIHIDRYNNVVIFRWHIKIV